MKRVGRGNQSARRSAEVREPRDESLSGAGEEKKSKLLTFRSGSDGGDG